jgi:hypothetical protein
MTEGTTASLANAFVRRSVLIAAGSDRDATDADLRSTGTGSVGRA